MSVHQPVPVPSQVEISEDASKFSLNGSKGRVAILILSLFYPIKIFGASPKIRPFVRFSKASRQ